jgi:hypothetical protein
MDRTGKGGLSPFNIPTRPNAFTVLKPDEVIERRGESALIFRYKPCPCPQIDRSPDCKIQGCFGGYIRNFQETALIDEEVSWKVEGQYVHTLYSPVDSVEIINTIINGMPRDLHVVSVENNKIKVSEILEYWRKVNLRYWVKMISEVVLTDNIIEPTRYYMPKLDNHHAMVDVIEAYVNGKNIMPSIIGKDMKGFYLFEDIYGDITIKLKLLASVKIGYHSWNLDKTKSEQGKFPYDSSDLQVVVPTYVQMSEGDIIIFLYSAIQTSQYVPFRTGNDDFLTYSPIKGIQSLHVKEHGKIVEKKKGIDFIVYRQDRIRWLTPKPLTGFSITYEYHPTYRVTGRMEGEGSEDRRKPFQYTIKAVNSFNPTL